MDRATFRQWGLELNEVDFARAFAALGVMRQWIGEIQGMERVSVEDTVRLTVLTYARVAASQHQPLPHAFNARALYDREGNIIPARVFADAWNSLLENFLDSLRDYSPPDERKYIRLEVYPPDTDLLWIVEQLSGLESVGAASVYVRSDEPSPPIGWDWPLRVGFLADEDSRQLREELTGSSLIAHPWMEPLVEFVTLTPGGDSCDLLLIPSDLRAAVAGVLGARTPLRADCVMVLGGARETSQNTTLLTMTLRSAVKTSGVGVLQVESGKRAAWFSELIRELSHDETIDVALYRACRRFGTPAPLLLAARKLIDFTRISRNIRILGERLRNAPPSRETIGVEGQFYSLGIEPGAYAPREIADLLEANAEHFTFDSEMRAATAYVALRSALSGTLAKASRPDPSPRWIQAQVFELRTDGGPVRMRRALRLGAPHAVAVRVGRESGEWETPPEEFTFPARDLPPEEDAHELTVVFSEPQLLAEPQTANITLPRAGDSSVCQFLFHLHEGVKQIEGRITVLHRNRVLQTALLLAAAWPEPEEAPDDYKVRLEPETFPRPDMAGLGSRRDFDAAFVLNRDATNAHGIMGVAGRNAFFRSPPNLKEFNDLLDSKLSDISASPNKYAGGLEADATVELLRTFARWGSQLYKDIIIDRVRNDFISGAERIQVVSADPGTRLPIEFFYDRKFPSGTANLCPHAGGALESGECQADCPGKSEKGDYFCPLGFWGLTKTIERHMHGKGPDMTEKNQDFGVQAEPVGDRNRLNLLKGVLIAASDNASNYEPEPGAGTSEPKGVEAVLTEVKRLWGIAPDPAKTWLEWLERVAKEHPTTLILLTHTVKKADDPIAALAICDGKLNGVKLELGAIGPEYVRNPTNGPEPLVMLIGCETGTADIAFFSFVSEFRRSGAAIVISTGVKVRGRHAIPITKELVALLGEHARKEAKSFGDVMLAARRRMLARGIPIVLTLMAFGDADWQIGLPKQ